MKTFRCALLTTCCLLATCSLAKADAKNYRQTLRSTTWVLAKNSGGTSSGTGVLVDAERKLVVTNAHVVGDSRAVVLFFADVVNDKPVVERKHYLDNVKKLGVRGKVVAVDRKRDLALVEMDRVPDFARAIELAPAGAGPGEDVESVGNSGSTDALWVYTSGTVRAVYQKQFRTGAGEHDFTVVETQSPINSGDSGGPVVNKDGKLVAIAQAIAPNARLVSYCVDISELKSFLSSPWKPAPLAAVDVLKTADVKFTEHPSGHYEIEINATEKEKQMIFVAKDVEYFERADVRRVWALAQTLDSPPTLDLTMKLLKQNAQTKLGSWNIEQTNDGKYMVMYCVKLDATAAPDALKSTMEYIAKLTLTMKKELSSTTQAQNAGDTLTDWLAK